jgi:hypothetical protein
VQATNLRVEESPQGRAATTQLRKLKHMLAGFRDKFPFAENEVNRLDMQVSAVIQAFQRASAESWANQEKCRARLAVLFAGTIERSIRCLRVDGPDEDQNRENRATKEFFGELWRRNSKYYFETKGDK